MVTPVLHDGVTPIPLTLFTMSDLSDVKSRTQYRPLYSPLTRSFGDNQPQPTSIQFTGLVYGDSFSEMMDRKDAYMAAAARGEQWLMFYSKNVPYSRQLQINRLLRKDTEWIEQRSMRVVQLMLEMELIAPFWQSVTLHSTTEALTVGETIFNLVNSGSRITYPTFLVTGTDITSVKVTIAGRSIQWIADAILVNLGGEALTIDCMRGAVRYGAITDIQNVVDGSLFPQLAVGTNEVSIEVEGGSGSVTILHRDAWEL